MSIRRMSAVMTVVLLAAAACTPRQEGADDPKQRLNQYISRSFAVRGVQDRADLASFLTGDAKVRIQGWSDEQFRQAFIDSKRQFIKLAFKEVKPISPTEVNITYELTYQTNYSDAQGKPHDAKITNRKLAQMLRENDRWMIADVRNIKELVEYKDEMSLP